MVNEKVWLALQIPLSECGHQKGLAVDSVVFHLAYIVKCHFLLTNNSLQMMLAHLMTVSHCALSTEFPVHCLCKEVAQIAALGSRYPKKIVIVFQLICCSLIINCSSTMEVQS